MKPTYVERELALFKSKKINVRTMFNRLSIKNAENKDNL